MKITKNQFPQSTILNQCIYCRDSVGKLTKEHIVPFGLNGQFTLQRASCETHQIITGRIEKAILRGPMWEARTRMIMSTRRKDERPKTFPIIYEKEGSQYEISYPVEKLPAWLLLPLYRLPAFIDKRHYDKRIKTISGGVWIVIGKRLLEELTMDLKADSISLSVTYTGHDFARFLAKIAYGFAIKEFGLSIRDNAYVLNTILGDSEDIEKWVGCSGKRQDKTNNLHEIRLSVENSNICAYIRLFSSVAVSPEYLVIVGPAPFQPQEDSLFICESTAALPVDYYATK